MSTPPTTLPNHTSALTIQRMADMLKEIQQLDLHRTDPDRLHTLMQVIHKESATFSKPVNAALPEYGSLLYLRSCVYMFPLETLDALPSTVLQQQTLQRMIYHTGWVLAGQMCQTLKRYTQYHHYQVENDRGVFAILREMAPELFRIHLKNINLTSAMYKKRVARFIRVLIAVHWSSTTSATPYARYLHVLHTLATNWLEYLGTEWSVDWFRVFRAYFPHETPLTLKSLGHHELNPSNQKKLKHHIFVRQGASEYKTFIVPTPWSTAALPLATSLEAPVHDPSLDWGVLMNETTDHDLDLTCFETLDPEIPPTPLQVTIPSTHRPPSPFLIDYNVETLPLFDLSEPQL
jgi:hypothetical protein